MAVGARVVPGQHPAIQAIQQAGSALSDMGKLFAQIKQNKTYEKSVEYTHWNNSSNNLLNAYDKVLEETNPAFARKVFSDAFVDMFVGGGMDRGVASELMTRIHEALNLDKGDPNNPISDRWLIELVRKEAHLDPEGKVDEARALDIVERERKRIVEAQAVPTIGGSTAPAAVPAASPFAAVQQSPEQPIARGIFGQTQEGEQGILQTPGTPPTADRPVLASKPDIGTPGGPPVRMLSMTPQAAGEALVQFRSAKGDQKKVVLKTLFPSLKSAPPSIYQAAEMILMGRQKGDDRLVQSGIAIWAKAAVKEATP